MAAPVIVILSAAALMGMYLGIQYLRGVRSKTLLNGIHLLLGAGGLESFLYLLNASGGVARAGPVGVTAALMLAAALFLGFTMPMIARRSPWSTNVLLAMHAGVGATGFVLFLAWVNS